MQRKLVRSLALAGLVAAAGSGAVLGARAAQEPGKPKPPAARGAKPEDPPPPIDFTEADRFFAIADYDGRGWISFREASKSLQIDQARFLAIDTSRDGRIELEEFRKVYADAITKVGAFPPPIPDPARGVPTSTPETGGPTPEPPPVTATSVEELFGRIEERDDGPEALPRPPRLVGPVPIFRRLDFDDDGWISVADLLDLGRPVANASRVRALIAILDENGDGGVDRAELRRSMQSKLAPGGEK